MKKIIQLINGRVIETTDEEYDHVVNLLINEHSYFFKEGYPIWTQEEAHKVKRRGEDLLIKEGRRKELEDAQKKAKDFKDMQKRETLGLLTLEEIETKRLKKEIKSNDWKNGNNK